MKRRKGAADKEEQMTFREIIEAVNDCKPNALPERKKFRHLAELEGKIAADVFLADIANIRELERKYPRDLDTEPLVTHPHQDVYTLWLEAKIDQENGEYNKYQNSMEAFNAAYGNFVRWFARTYAPAQGYPPGRCSHCQWDPPYYITAYSLAVMMGFQGTVEEWLASLKGEKGDMGKDTYEYALEQGYEGTREEFWAKLLADYALENHDHSIDEAWLEKILKRYATRDYANDRTAQNLLDNSWFPQPVNQRQQLMYAVYGYTIDRWLSDAVACTVELTDAGVLLKNTNVEGNISACFYQRLEASAVKEGKIYTMAVGLEDGSVFTHTLAAGERTAGQVGTVAELRLNGGNGGRWRFDIWIYGQRELTVSWAALYEGAFTADTLPAYRRRGYAQEYLECCRYYYAAEGGTQLTGFATGTTTAALHAYLPAKMRANPVIGGTIAFLRTQGQDLRENLGSMTEVSNVDGNCAFIILTGASGLTAFQAIYAGVAGFSLSAEL
jgi:hypothetical protein